MRRRSIGTLTLSAGLAASPPAIAQTPPSEDVGLGSAIGELVLRGDCRMVIVGDSISVKNQDDPTRSGMYWGVIRTWQPEQWAGVCVPSNNRFPTIRTVYIDETRATRGVRNLQSDPPGNRDFSYGYDRFAPAAAVDTLFELGDAPDHECLISNRLLLGGSWNAGDWFDANEIASTVVHLRTPETIGSARVRVRRGDGGFISGPVEDRSGSLAVVGWEAPRLPIGAGDAELCVATAGGYDESAGTDHFIWLTTRFYRPGIAGFQLDALAVGGARLRDWLSSGPYADDDRLGEYFGATGNPNLFYIQIGANDLVFPASWAQDYAELIERLERVSQQQGTTPRYILVPPYGTIDSVRHTDALQAADHLYAIASQGTASVDPSRIGFVNLPELLGGPIDQSLLLDQIHPRPAGADMLARELWRAITGLPSLNGCDADFTETDDPINPRFGVPDGQVDAADFNFFLDAFAAGDLDFADLTGSDDPGDPSHGEPDGQVDAADYNFFLDAFAVADARADLTGSDDPFDPGFGRPDGVLDAEDYFYFLERFALQDPVADLTGSSDLLDPDYGRPDGELDSDDFFYFFDLFEAGCR